MLVMLTACSPFPTVQDNVADERGVAGAFSYREPWSVGDEIVIATTSFQPLHSEVRTITALSVSGSNTVLTLNEPLEHKHIGKNLLSFDNCSSRKANTTKDKFLSKIQ